MYKHDGKSSCGTGKVGLWGKGGMACISIMRAVVAVIQEG